MKFRSLAPAIVSMAFALALSSTITAQKQDTPERRPGLTIRMETDLVVIDVTATDKNGNYARDLRENELEVYEDGKLRKYAFAHSITGNFMTSESKPRDREFNYVSAALVTPRQESRGRDESDQR